MTKAEKIKYLLFPAIGFGLGGALWGRSYILESAGGVNLFVAALIGLIGTFSLILFLKDIKTPKKIFIILAGTFVWIIVISIMDVGVSFLALVFPLGIIIYLLLLGAIVGLFYALTLRIRIWPIVWRGGGGFVLGSIINLTATNLLGSIFSFALTGIILGLALGWGLYRGQKPK